MRLLLDIAWPVSHFLSYAGLIITLCGVGVFGWHFVRINGAAAKTESGAIPAASWGGPGAKLGFKILAAGVAVIALSIFLGAMLPGRY